MSGHLIALIAVPTFIIWLRDHHEMHRLRLTQQQDRKTFTDRWKRRGLKRMTIRQGTGEVAIDEPAKNPNEML